VTRRVVVSMVALVAAVLLVLEVPLGINFARLQQDRLVTNLERDAVVIGSLVEDQLQAGTNPVTADFVDDELRRTDARILVTDAAGVSVLDTSDAFGVGRDYSTRPEVATALAGGRASGDRSSETLGEDLVYVAVPVASGGVVHGTVRITYPRAEVQSRIARNWLLLAGVAASVLLTTVVVGTALARWVTGPVRDLGDAAKDLADGELDRRAPDAAGPPEVRRLAMQFNTMAARLQELVQSQRAFVADASHQLRSPLTALRLELESLVAVTNAETRDGLERAVDESLRLGRLLDGLLVLARGDGQRPVPADVDAAAIARARHHAWQPVAREVDVDLRCDTPASCRAMAVEGHLEQIVDNLLANAVEATPAGGHIDVAVASHTEGVIVTVTDNGPGMTDTQLERAFDRFWRPPDAPAGSGTGLGLAIARQLARAGGGDVDLGHAPGGGLRAAVTLPASAAP